MENGLPDIQVFKFISKGDFFVEHEDYKYIAEYLGLREWNSVVWMGRLFSLDNDFGEHWFDNFELIEQKESLIEELGLSEQSIFVLDPSRFKDDKDGPCHSQELRKLFWTDVLRNLKINLATLFEKAREHNEKQKSLANVPEEYLPDIEEQITDLLRIYAPDSPLFKERIFSNLDLEPKLIKEIAEMLDAGMRCYVDKQTKELGFVPDMEDGFLFDTEEWEEDMQKFESNPDAYWQFEKMSSRKGFMVMEGFADQVTDKELKDRLYRALSRRKPFQNFKFEIDNSGDFRNQWFAYKKHRYELFVIEQLKLQMRE